MQRLLDRVEFRDPARARRDIARIGNGIPERILARIELMLGSMPDPDEALHYLERLRAESPAAFDRIAASPNSLRLLLITFSYSGFLADAILRRPEFILQLSAAGTLQRLYSAEEMEDQLLEFLGSEFAAVPDPLMLARFRRRQILRIMLRDVLGNATLSEITEELSNLSDAILDLAYRRIRDDVALRYGEPRYMDANGDLVPCKFSVIALGKLGGRELNYSSDIDLMFVYSGNGETDGPNRITNKEFFKKVANQYTDLLSTYTNEGMCYRVDLRLRPDGRYGEICISLDGARTYYEARARDWELQMLIKGRVAAGDREPGRDLLDVVEPLIYSSSLDFRAVEAVSETRERISEKLAARHSPQTGLDVKLAPGGIRDIEFLVQCLQRLHGGRDPWVRHGGTMLALSRLLDKRFLSEPEYARLVAAYRFLRNLEHRLQLDQDRQVHTLPVDPDALGVLARKMPAGSGGALDSADALERELDSHLENVRELYDRVMNAQQASYYLSYSDRLDNPLSTPGVEEAADAGVPYVAPLSTNVERYLDQKAPRMAETLSRLTVYRGRERFSHFLEKVLAAPELLARLDGDPELVAAVVDLFEHSNYFGDQLLRHPALLEEVAPSEYRLPDEPLEDLPGLRRFFRRQMLRIESESIVRATPIFTTLERTSDLADAVIAAAYRIALKEAAPPQDPAYAPADQMMVIALGRLGMREFDLASDADLVFVIPDPDAGEQVFWTRVAERMINTISAYTGDGVIFTVDTRLRPNGREGALVQTEGSYRDYFANRAQAWEGITYMKSRAVAGSVERATEFLHQLQEVDWRRYGQGGRSRKQLAEMRMRLEKEQGGRNPLKAGTGGYYDIDFALMYLRLKGAGIFYKVLNSPARIDVIEQMGHLDREDADFLRDAATFYRAVDHGLRVSTGQAEGSLPTSQLQMEVLSELVSRWTPAHLRDRPLDVKLGQIRHRTREFFNRLFGV